MKTVLVTGGAGFLGSHLCRALLAKGLRVVALDNLSTGRLENLVELNNHPHFRFVRHDVIVPFDEPVDFICNFACPASPPRYQADPIHTTKTSVLGTLNMLELARKYNARIVHASTSEVYGDPEVHPQPESYWGNVNPIGIRSCYDEGKRCAETLCFDYKRMHHLDVRVVRIFNTYGPHMDPCDGRVVSNFIVSALQGAPLEVYGDGLQTRSFCYVDDLIRGIVALLELPQAPYQPVNLGNPIELKVIDIARLVLEMTQSSSRIVHKPLPQDDPTRRRPDITLAKKLLNWEPTIDVKAGLARTIEYFSGGLASSILKRRICASNNV